MASLVASMVAVGAIFGSIQVTVTAYTGTGAGLLYACLGAGSAAAGVAYAWLPRSFRLDTRQLVFSVTLVLGMAFLALSPWPVLGILVAGCAVAPYMITLAAAWWAPVGCAAAGLAVALVRRAGLGRRPGCRTGRGA